MLSQFQDAEEPMPVELILQLRKTTAQQVKNCYTLSISCVCLNSVRTVISRPRRPLFSHIPSEDFRHDRTTGEVAGESTGVPMSNRTPTRTQTWQQRMTLEPPILETTHWNLWTRVPPKNWIHLKKEKVQVDNYCAADRLRQIILCKHSAETQRGRIHLGRRNA